MKDKLAEFFDLLLDTKEKLLRLNKYKGHKHYKEGYLNNIKEVNRAFIFLKNEISASNNDKLKSAFKKVDADIRNIVEFKNPESSLQTVNWIEEYWPQIEIACEGKIQESKHKLKNLHPEIRKVSEKLFTDGHNAQAIEEAFKKVISLVKKKAGRMDLDGYSLMSTVFSRQTPVLKFNGLVDKTDEDEQQGWMHLYQGAVMGIRNVKAHGNIVQKGKQKTFEYLAFASLLCRRLDDAKN